MPESKAKQVDLTKVRPYGDTMDDGAVQLSFTLPIPYNPEAIEAAKLTARQLGMKDAAVVYSEDLGGYSFFVVYGHTRKTVDVTQIKVPQIDGAVFSRDQANEEIRHRFGRKLVIVGACIGTDAHTVGIDAIMNMKGYDGHYGLERYEMVETFNLGAQVPPESLLKKAVQHHADAILVSQVITEKGFHRQNLSRMVELVEAAKIRDHTVLVCGGPRIDHRLALELGFDAGFGRGTYPENVISLIIEKLTERLQS